MDSMTNAFTTMGQELYSGATEIKLSLQDFGNSVKTVFTDTLPNAWESTKKFFTETEFSFRDIGSAAQKMGRGLVDVAKQAGSGLFQMGRDAASAAVQLTGLFQSQLDLNDAQAEGAKGAKGGGVVGGLGKALGGALKLFTPILNILGKVFSPLIEGIGEHISNAFGPLQMVMEMIAQDLGPKIAKLLVPFVAMMEILVTQIGQAMSSLLDGPDLLGTISALITGIMPPLSKILQAVIKVVQKLLPVALKLIQSLLPIVMQVVDILADTLVDVLGIIGDIWEQVGPLLVETFVELLKAIMPLIKPLLKLAKILLEKVFGPLLIKTIQLVAKLIGEVLVPAIEMLVKFVIPIIESISESLADFFGNFEKYMTDFYILFVQPIVQFFKDVGITIGEFVSDVIGFFTNLWDGITEFVTDAVDLIGSIPGRVAEFIAGIGRAIAGFFTNTIPGLWSSFWEWVMGLGTTFMEWLSGLWDSIISTLGLDSIVEGAKGAFQVVIDTLMAPINAVKGIINDWIIDTANDILAWDPPVIPGGNVADILFDDPSYRIPLLAAGGITKPEAVPQGGVQAVVGEAGPEMILPLRGDLVRSTLAPAFEGIEVPGIDQMIGFLESIDRRLGGTLRVDGMGGASGGPAPAGMASEPGVGLSDAVGIGGI
jgi:phage-related protein